MRPTSNISTFTSPSPHEGGRVLNPLLRGLVPYAAFDPTGGKEMLVKGDMAAMGVGFAGRFGSELKLYMVEARGGRWKSAQQVDELIDLCIKWRPRQVFIEENMGKGWLRENIAIHVRGLHMHLPIVYVSASKYGTGTKSQRIEALQTPYKYHQIGHAADLKGSEFERQVLSWTPEGKGLDDFPDMLALMWLGINRLQFTAGTVRVVGKGRDPIYRSTGV